MEEGERKKGFGMGGVERGTPVAPLGTIGVVGSRVLSAKHAPVVGGVVDYLIDRGFHIASGGAVGADHYALADDDLNKRKFEDTQQKDERIQLVEVKASLTTFKATYGDMSKTQLRQYFSSHLRRIIFTVDKLELHLRELPWPIEFRRERHLKSRPTAEFL